MTDRKFTDEEIKTGLRCLSGEIILCKFCAFSHLEDHGFACKKNVANATLALINRQKAEIERLQAVNADMTESLRLAAEANKDMQAEIEVLHRGKLNIKFKTGDYAKIADNKSGHEFEIGTIVKLEKHDDDYKAFANDTYWWVTDNDLAEIDNDTFVKEMTEGR